MRMDDAMADLILYGFMGPVAGIDGSIYGIPWSAL